MDSISISESPLLGSSGSRLISGNSQSTEILEQKISDFHGFETGLIFNSGYDANLSLYASIPTQRDTIILDELCHASIMDGARLSRAKVFKFRHNELKSLRQKLDKSTGNIFIGIESLYSMDGDFSPLTEIIHLAEKFDANIILDEAHAVGVYGEDGKGFAHLNRIQNRLLATVVTFGKALGVHGAIVLGSPNLRKFLINKARPFIYSTAPIKISVNFIDIAYDFLKETNSQENLHKNIAFFIDNIPIRLKDRFLCSKSQIQSLIIGSEEKTKEISNKLIANFFFVYPITNPTVKVGTERIRFCIHSFNTFEEITSLMKSLDEIDF